MIDKKFKKNENIILISVKAQNQSEENALNSLNELEEMVYICGGKVVKKIVQNLEKANFYHYLGSSKVEELKKYIDEYNCKVVVADDELSSLQLKTLRKILGIKVIGRTRMILEVFSEKSKNEEMKLLIEMIKLKYYLPLQSEEEKSSMMQQMIGFHEKVNDIDKKYKLEKENRKKSRIPSVAIVGYCNAGKTTLLNKLSGEDNLCIEDKLFKTMDPATKILKLPNRGETFFCDTVGFIRKLPYNLIKLLHIFLSEIDTADVIIHIIDISCKDFEEKQEVVDNILDLMKIDKNKVIQVYNKIDLIELDVIKDENSVYASIEKNINIDKIIDKTEKILRGNLEKLELIIPYDKSNLIPIINEYGEGIVQEHTKDGILLKGYIEKNNYNMIASYITNVF